jgi:REP element-mobilizing transposase RayT
MATPLQHGKYYHIYNRGNNKENIFSMTKDYEHFLELLDIYIIPVADIVAWCLMKNHLHLLIRVKEENEIGFLNSEFSNSDNYNLKWKTFFPENQTENFTKKPEASSQFQHLFNAYAKWYNLQHTRVDSLFSKNNKKVLIDNSKYYKKVIVYIHNNPVKHNFVEDKVEYPWSSYLITDSSNPKFIDKKKIYEIFANQKSYVTLHNQNPEIIERIIQDYIIE